MNEIRIVIEGLQELTAAINRLTAQRGVTEEVQTPAASTQIPVYSGAVPQTPSPAPQMQTGQPAGMLVQAGQPFQNSLPGAPAQGTLPVQQSGPLPTTAVAQGYTYDQLAVAAAGLVNQGKQQQLLEILQAFGVNAMTEIPKERYGEFAAAIKAKGAVI